MQETPDNHGSASMAVLEAPPERVGLLLADARTRRGLTLEDACRLSGVLEPAELMALEGGAITVGEEVFDALAGLYGVSTADLVPPRDHLVVDLCEGYLRAGGEMTLLTSGVGRHDVLSRYLEMIWEMRCVEPGSEVPLRDADLEVLGESFETDPGALRTELLRMMRERVRSVPKRRVLVSLGAAIAVVTGGVLMWQAAQDPSPAEAVAVTVPAVTAEPAASSSAAGQLPPAPRATIGDAVVQERGGEQVVIDGELPPAPAASIGDAAVQERNLDGSPAPQTTR